MPTVDSVAYLHLFLLAAAIPLMWAFADAPGERPRLWLAIVTVAAFVLSCFAAFFDWEKASTTAGAMIFYSYVIGAAGVRRSDNGSKADDDATTVASCRSYYDAYYHPNTAHVIVVRGSAETRRRRSSSVSNAECPLPTTRMARPA